MMTAKQGEKITWTTWEELLLACAVKRHGVNEWDSIALELQSRTSLPVVLTAEICRNKYEDLKERFMDYNLSSDEVDTIPWLEELRKLRVAELKQEVHRHDLSIQSLQLKVKRLEEDRERSLEANENDDQKPDLEKHTKDEASPENVAGDDSDKDNRSCNQSNSTDNRKAQPVKEDSCNDSSDTIAKQKPSQKKKIVHDSAEVTEPAAELKEETKESSDVQSSASLTKKIRRRVEITGGDEPVLSPATIKRDSVKSEPLVAFLDVIRSHKYGSMFERRFESQKTDKYNNMIRQHVDIQTVQTRIHNGSYSSCTTKFYLDLLLLFTNATVFFPKSSPESLAANHLRYLVLKELKKKKKRKNPINSLPLKPEPPPLLLQPKLDPDRSDPLLAKQKSTAPIVVCRKRSSITTKPSSSNKQPDEKSPVVNPKPPFKSSSEVEKSVKLKVNETEKPVTGARSMRRSSNNTRGNNVTTDKNPAPMNKVEVIPKVEKKTKTDVTPTTMAAKKSGAADFLKRIKKNSPGKVTTPETIKNSGETIKNSGEDGNGSRKRDQQKKRVDEQKDGVKQKGGGKQQLKEDSSSPSKRGVGRPPKRGKEAAPVKRAREVEEAEVVSKRPKKRSKR